MMSLVNLETWFRTLLKCSVRSTVLSDVRTGAEPPKVKLRWQQLSLLRCSFSHNRLFTVISLVCKACFAWSVLGRSSKWWFSWDVLLMCRLHLVNKLCNIDPVRSHSTSPVVCTWQSQVPQMIFHVRCFRFFHDSSRLSMSLFTAISRPILVHYTFLLHCWECRVGLVLLVVLRASLND